MQEREQKSAQIIHELGKAYRMRSPDKKALIRSAVLFNASRVRRPENLNEVEADLKELCSHVLELANRDTSEADLVGRASELFQLVKDMRSSVRKRGDNVQSASQQETGSEDQELQDKITESYKNIMHKVMDSCIETLGAPPWQYAVVGVGGGLAHNEVTPESGFKSAIFLEDGVSDEGSYDDATEYFQWMAVAFQLVLISFGETSIEAAETPSLNNPDSEGDNWFHDAKTPRGISPEGFATTYGEDFPVITELKVWKIEAIKPVNEILEFLAFQEKRDDGCEVCAELRFACFVSGNKRVCDAFVEALRRGTEVEIPEHNQPPENVQKTAASASDSNQPVKNVLDKQTSASTDSTQSVQNAQDTEPNTSQGMQSSDDGHDTKEGSASDRKRPFAPNAQSSVELYIGPTNQAGNAKQCKEANLKGTRMLTRSPDAGQKTLSHSKTYFKSLRSNSNNACFVRTFRK